MEVDGGGSLAHSENGCNYRPHQGNCNFRNQSAGFSPGHAKGPIDYSGIRHGTLVLFYTVKPAKSGKTLSEIRKYLAAVRLVF
ncbi:MAG: hypothetical protein CMJ62_04085 [Planctomycetaceae bacterium]|jgi:hypothetical protein|nr:hypothetical protein [Planctomycetaceae bacterium]